MAKWIIGGVGLVALAGAAATAAYFWTPAGPTFDGKTARQAAAAYDARVIRDKFGVPHIYGARNADVVFGLGYAHAEDDWPTIEEVVRSNRGKLAELMGKADVSSDRFMLALGNIDAVEARYEAEVSPAAKAIAEGYVAGLNLWCAEHPESECARTAPVRPQDIIAGYANRPPFFYGLDGEIQSILKDERSIEMAVKSPREAYLQLTDDVELGSNGIAVSPLRATDGHTRLAVNSHQPYTGRVAWYEARLKSEEGIDIIGGVFPGTPLILHGAGPNMGWAATVNKPDIYDVFKLTVDSETKPTKYRLDGQWRDLRVKDLKYRVKLWGPFSQPVRERGLWSAHGPVFVTKRGVFAVSYTSDGELRYLDQYLAMNMAKTVADWRAAQASINAIPSVNYVAADSQGHIAYFYNARMPKREEGWDRSKVLPGDISDVMWKGVEPVERLPVVMDPASGFVANANNTPFIASGAADNPKPENYPPSFGIETNMTNRAMRAQELFGGDPSIDREEFIAYKLDDAYSVGSNVRKMVRELVAAGAGDDVEMKAAVDLIASWDGSTGMDNRGTALAVLTGQKAMGGQMHGEATLEKKQAALKETAATLKAVYGRIDPQWSEVSRISRGDRTWPTNGGPDTLRAVYGGGDLAAQKALHGRAGDTYIAIADWAPDGTYRMSTIHQFGSATLDPASPHYADQTPLFAAEQFKEPPMTLDGVLAEAERDYRPGHAAAP
jgi:acyl-homoserine-lactone acylase